MTIKWMTSALLAVPMILSNTACSTIPSTTNAEKERSLEGGATPLSIERLYASPALAGTSPRGLKLSPDGTRVTYLAGRKDDQYFYDLWQMDVASGKQSILLDAD